MEDKKTRRLIPLGSATLTIVGSVIAFKLTESLSNSQSWGIVLGWMVAGIIVTYLVSRVQARSQEESPEAIRERLSQLEPELRKQVQMRSYGARRNLIEAPLRELDLDVKPRLGWVRDPRLIEPESVSEKAADDIVAAFESSKRRMLIVGEPGSGKTIAAYSLIEYLDNTEGNERVPLLVNLSAWDAQEDFETFLVDYLRSSVGYEVHERAVARAFIDSDRYSLILDGLDEIPLSLRGHFSERLDEFVGGLAGEIGVVVTCRTQEYEQLLASHATGLGLVNAVEILPLTDRQLDRAFAELAKRNKDWETFLSQRHYTAYQRVRHLLSNPLFLNLAVFGHLSPDELLDSTTTEQDLQDFVLETYLNRALADPRHYEPEDARRYLSWVACFLNGSEVSPIGHKTTDFTVFDLADLTPPEPPRLYRFIEGLVLGMGLWLGWGVIFMLAVTDFGSSPGELVWRVVEALILGLFFGLTALPGALVLGLGLAVLPNRWWPVKRSAVSSRLTLASWPSTRRELLGLLRRVGRGLLLGLVGGLIGELAFSLDWSGLLLGLDLVLVLGPVLGLGFGLLETRSLLIASRTPKEARSRSLITALTWLVSGSVAGLGSGLVLFAREGWLSSVGWALVSGLCGLVLGLVAALDLALRNGGWFVLLQKVAHRRLARTGNFPSPPYDFLEWGVETQIFRRVGGGVRFRHNLIQQHLAKSHQQQPCEAEARSEGRGPKLALAGVLLALAVWDTVVWVVLGGWGLGVAFRDQLRIAVILLGTSAVVYLFLKHRQGVTFQEALLNWPMAAVAGVVALLLQLFWFVLAFHLNSL